MQYKFGNTTQLPHQWLFGPFRLDPANALCWRGEQAMPLTPKAFDMLCYFVAHAGQLVTKDNLLEALWPETEVSEAVLKVRVNELRKALGDMAQAPQFIATVRQRGYRFIAPVTALCRPYDLYTPCFPGDC